MIQALSRVNILDNTGGIKGGCIKVLGGSKRKTSSIGDIIVVSIKHLRPHKKVKKGEIRRAILVQVIKSYSHHTGNTVSFKNNGIVLFNSQGKFLGSRVASPLSFKLRQKRQSKAFLLSNIII